MKRQSNTGHRWTDAEMKELIRMWMDDKSIEEIGAHFKVTARSILVRMCRLRKEGIPIPRRKQGHIAGRRNKPWTQEEVEYIVRRRKDKATAEDIARELDRTVLAVQAMIRTLRAEGVPVGMLGCGVRRLWDPEKLKMAAAGRGLGEESEDIDMSVN